jgi:hypothetical protein
MPGKEASAAEIAALKEQVDKLSSQEASLT